MKLKLITLLVAASTCSLFAAEKSTVTLSKGGHSISGGGDRETEIRIKLSNGWNNGPMKTEDKIKALKQKIVFYELMRANKIDLSKPITAAYASKPLSEVLKELIPGIAVKYENVSPQETVESMAITKTPLEKVLTYLDDAAGVYFTYTAEGLTVSSKPK